MACRHRTGAVPARVEAREPQAAGEAAGAPAPAQALGAEAGESAQETAPAADWGPAPAQALVKDRAPGAVGPWRRLALQRHLRKPCWPEPRRETPGVRAMRTQELGGVSSRGDPSIEYCCSVPRATQVSKGSDSVACALVGRVSPPQMPDGLLRDTHHHHSTEVSKRLIAAAAPGARSEAQARRALMACMDQAFASLEKPP